MKKCYLIPVFFMVVTLINAQSEARIKELREQLAAKDTLGWVIGTGLGFDFGQLLQINPSVGAGENRILIGGIGSLFANYKNGRLAWDNNADLLLGVQKLGSGISTLAPGEKVPFQKSIDELRFGSKLGYKTNETSKFYYSVLLTFQSQVTSTYSDTSLVDPVKGNYLRDLSGKDQGPIAKFLSPARITFSPGIDYKPNSNWSLFISPASVKMVVIADEDIAAIPARDADGNPFGGVNIHGTEWNGPNDYKQLLFQLGATFNAQYVNKFLNDKFTFKSGFTLFSNYLENPQNIDVDWTTESAFSLWKGLSIALNTRLFYDDDIPVQITDRNAEGGVRGLGNRVSFTEQLYLKYNYIF